METVTDFIILGSEITADGDCSHEIKRHLVLWRKADKPRQHIIKQRCYFAAKGRYSQSYDFSSSRVWMWELDHKENSPKELMLLNCGVEDSWKSKGVCEEIKPINPKGNQSWIFIGRMDTEAEAPILWPPDVSSLEKTVMLGKIEDRRRKGWKKMRWLDGITDSMDEFEQAPGVGDGQGSLACCSPWGRKQLDTTEQLNWRKKGFPHGSDRKESAWNAGDPSSIPWLGRSPGGGHGNLLQYSCLENPRDRGTWWATVHGVSKSRTQLSD